MKFETIVAPTITELFEKQIEQMIFSGTLTVGEKLPTERELADSMNISKSIVHLGIKNLERKGFLRIVPRRGVYVANYSETGNIATLTALLEFHGGNLDKETTRSLIQVREGLEGIAMELLSKNHTEKQIAHLRELVEDFRMYGTSEPSPDITVLSEKIFLFNLYICIYSGNNIIPLLFNGFRDISLLFWRTWLQFFSIEETALSMENFINCIANGNSNGALIEFRKNVDSYMKKVGYS